MVSHSRDALRPRLACNLSPSKSEGAGNAGCALHPRSRAQCAQKSAHTSIQVQRRTSDIPCAIALRLTSSSPRRTALLPPLRPGKSNASQVHRRQQRDVRTTRLRRTRQSRSSVATSASTATRPSPATMANAPLSGTGWQIHATVCTSDKAKYFWFLALTRILIIRIDLPVAPIYPGIRPAESVGDGFRSSGSTSA